MKTKVQQFDGRIIGHLPESAKKLVSRLRKDDGIRNPIEISDLVFQLKVKYGVSPETIALVMNKEIATVHNILRLHKMPLTVKRYVENGDIKPTTVLSVSRNKHTPEAIIKAVQQEIQKESPQLEMASTKTSLTPKTRKEISKAIDDIFSKFLGKDIPKKNMRFIQSMLNKVRLT